ncbi:MAG: NYN domain-containing protein [Nanoarchaeota archaeon]|jgi:uncharacterized LabA/DUF88 family protein|nr:NYN domain-containing protein [Nanoarchaeota archaeon]
MKERVSVYIDGANFYGGLTSIDKKFVDNRFDVEKYVNDLIGNNRLVRISYYNAFVKKKINGHAWKKQKDFFDRLHKIPRCKVTLCTRKSRLNILGEEYHTIKGDDIFLALDVIEDCYNDKFDRIVLISGGADFVELLKRIKKKGKSIEVCYFEKCVSNVLLRKADKVRVINKKVIKKYFWSS